MDQVVSNFLDEEEAMDVAKKLSEMSLNQKSFVKKERTSRVRKPPRNNFMSEEKEYKKQKKLKKSEVPLEEYL